MLRTTAMEVLNGRPNRTFMELKFYCCHEVAHLVAGPNRTFMELKWKR